jgi:predicted MFS family arabinose efflux permease
VKYANSCRTGRYKLPTVLSALSSALCFTLLLLFWHGDTHPSQSLFVFFAGFGTGIVGSTSFVAVSAGVGEKQIAVAASGLYLSANVGNLAGIAASNALFQNFLRHRLQSNLEGVENGLEVCLCARFSVRRLQSHC